MTVVTSKISPVTIGQGRNKETIYTATRTTKLADGTYDVEMLQYSDAKGAGGRVIAEREGVNNWNFNSNASGKVKQNQGRLNQASKNQMESMRGDFVTKSQETEEYNRAQGNPNKAKNPPGTGDNTNPANVPATPSRPSARESFGEGIVYPLGLGNSKQDIITFNMLKYEPKKCQGLGFSERTSLRNSIGSVILPVPGGIQDANSVNWGSSDMNPLEIALASMSLGFINEGGSGLVEASKNVGQGVKAGAGDAKTAIAAMFASQATGAKDLLTRTTGAIINPNMELLFKGPQLRPFTFTFKMSARSQDEAKNIIKIIRFFKQGMAPIQSASNIFLKSPHTFRIQYKLRGETDHPYIGKIKECALQSCGVQYTPEGTYATYHDGVMASYQMTLTFSELEPVFNNDYEDDNDQSIGF